MQSLHSIITPTFSLMVQKPDPEDLLSSVHHHNVQAALVRFIGELVHPGSGLDGPGQGRGLVITAERHDTFMINFLLGIIKAGILLPDSLALMACLGS